MVKNKEERNRINRRLDDVLEKLQYLGMVIKNLKGREGTLITDLQQIDERLFREISSYELLTEQLKRDFLRLLVRDAKSLSNACIRNPNNFSKISGEFRKMQNLLGFLKKHEEVDIEKSKELQEMISDAKTKIEDIRNFMRGEVDNKLREKRDLQKEMYRRSK